MKEKLSINGGKSVVPSDIIKPWPHITEADRKAVMEVLSHENISEQRKAQSESLAKEWAEYLGRKHCIPTNSGTAALHMALAPRCLRLLRPGVKVGCL